MMIELKTRFAGSFYLELSQPFEGVVRYRKHYYICRCPCKILPPGAIITRAFGGSAPRQVKIICSCSIATGDHYLMKVSSRISIYYLAAYRILVAYHMLVVVNTYVYLGMLNTS